MAKEYSVWREINSFFSLPPAYLVYRPDLKSEQFDQTSQKPTYKDNFWDGYNDGFQKLKSGHFKLNFNSPSYSDIHILTNNVGFSQVLAKIGGHMSLILKLTAFCFGGLAINQFLKSSAKKILNQ